MLALDIFCVDGQHPEAEHVELDDTLHLGGVRPAPHASKFVMRRRRRNVLGKRIAPMSNEKQDCRQSRDEARFRALVYK